MLPVTARLLRICLLHLLPRFVDFTGVTLHCRLFDSRIYPVTFLILRWLPLHLRFALHTFVAFTFAFTGAPVRVAYRITLICLPVWIGYVLVPLLILRCYTLPFAFVCYAPRWFVTLFARLYAVVCLLVTFPYIAIVCCVGVCVSDCYALPVTLRLILPVVTFADVTLLRCVDYVTPVGRLHTALRLVYRMPFYLRLVTHAPPFCTFPCDFTPFATVYPLHVLF